MVGRKDGDGMRKRRFFSVVCTMLMVTMGLGAFANTGCNYPWDDIDNMIVTAGITLEDNDTFAVNGGVTSASIKALGYVSGAAEAVAAFEAAEDMTDGFSMRPSAYDMFRWDSSARREIDYARVSGMYNSYYGRASPLSIMGEDGTDTVRDYDNHDYAQAVQSVSGLAMSDSFIAGETYSPLGQIPIDFSFVPADFTAFDASGIPNFDGKIENISDNFLFQTFSWRMDNIQGKGYGEDGAVIYVKSRSDGAVDVRYSVNGTDLAGEVLDYADIFMMPNLDGTVDYRVIVVTDAMRFLNKVGEELKVSVHAEMQKYEIVDWATVGDDIENNAVSLSTSVKNYMKTSSEVSGLYAKNQFDSLGSGGITSLISGMDSVFGGWQVGPVSNFLTGGIANNVADANDAAIENIRSQYNSYLLDPILTHLKGYTSVQTGAISPEFESLWTDISGGEYYVFDWATDGKYYGSKTIRSVPIDFSFDGDFFTTNLDMIKTRQEEWDGVHVLVSKDYRKLAATEDAGWYNSDDGDGEGSKLFNEWYDRCIVDIRLRWQTAIEDVLVYEFPEFDMTTFIIDGGVSAFDGDLTKIKAASLGDNLVTYVMDTFGGGYVEWQSQFDEIWFDFGNIMNNTFNNSGLPQFNFTPYTNLADIWPGFANITVSDMTNMTIAFKEQRDAFSQNLSSVIKLYESIGFYSGFNEDLGVWTFDVDWNKFNSSFDCIESIQMPTPNYIFTEDMFDGEYYIPVKLDVTNSDMLDNMSIEVFSISDTRSTETTLNTINCSKVDGDFYRIPIELDVGYVSLRARATFTNGTPATTDDIVMETLNMPGFGDVRVLDMSIESMIQRTNNYFFQGGNTSDTYSVRLVVYDVNDKAELPFTAYIGGSTKSVTLGSPGSASMRWSINYIRQHSYTGKIIITNSDGEVVHEEAIPEFSFKDAAFAESERSSDTLALSEMEEDSEYAKFGDW